MQVGDLVKARCPTTKQVDKAFLVTELSATGTYWIKVLGYDGWKRVTDFEVVNESR